MAATRYKARLGLAAAALAAAACGGDPDQDLAPLTVTISWSPNRELGVNQPGGGYEVALPGQPAIDLPYVSGPVSPTAVTVSLPPGAHTVTVRAYAAFDAQGGTTRTYSAPQELRLSVR